MRFTTLLRHGVIAGGAAGMAAALMLWLVVEPVIRRALVIEAARGGEHGHVHAEEPLVSRTVQVLGGVVTSSLVGLLFGVVFAVVFAKVRHRMPGSTDCGRALVLASIGFAVFTLVPALKVPANPPAVGDASTVTERTLLYLLTILLGLLVIGVTGRVDRLVRSRDAAAGNRYAVDVLAATTSVVLILVLVPNSPDTVPSDVPADLLWDFRLASLAQLGAMWLVLGLGFGVLVESRTRKRRAVAQGSV